MSTGAKKLYLPLQKFPKPLSKNAYCFARPESRREREREEGWGGTRLEWINSGFQARNMTIISSGNIQLVICFGNCFGLESDIVDKQSYEIT